MWVKNNFVFFLPNRVLTIVTLNLREQVVKTKGSGNFNIERKPLDFSLNLQLT
jgi:hypothetical protein